MPIIELFSVSPVVDLTKMVTVTFGNTSLYLRTGDIYSATSCIPTGGRVKGFDVARPSMTREVIAHRTTTRRISELMSAWPWGECCYYDGNGCEVVATSWEG